MNELEESEGKGRHAVIVGIGVISPVGIGVREFWKSLLESKSGVGKISRFDASTFPTRIAAEVRDFKPGKRLGEKEIKYYSLTSQYAAYVADMAMDDADLVSYDSDFPLYMGTGLGPTMEVTQEAVQASRSGLREFDRNLKPTDLIRAFHYGPAPAAALRVGCSGKILALSAACVSGMAALDLAVQDILGGETDMAIAGGVDNPLTNWVHNGFCVMKILSRENETPEKAVRPWDKHRKRTVTGDGGVALLLMEREKAREMGLRIYCEVERVALGAAPKNPLFMTEESGKDWAGIIDKALGGIRPDLIIGHGPGDTAIDLREYHALQKSSLGSELADIPLVSIKAQVGSSISAAPMLNLVAGVMSLMSGVLPGTRNHDTRDPRLPLKVSVRQAGFNPSRALVNSAAFGAVVGCALLRRYEHD